MVYHLVLVACERHPVRPNIILMSSSWDFIFNSTKNNHNILTICPKPIAESYQYKGHYVYSNGRSYFLASYLNTSLKKSYFKYRAYTMDDFLQSFLK